MKRRFFDGTSRLARILVTTLCVTAVAAVAAGSSACRDSKKDAPVEDAAVAASTASAAAAASETASAPSAARPPEAADSIEDVTDGGADAGKRKRRRLIGAGLDAGAVDTQTAAAPANDEAPAPSGKRAPALMGNEQVYGASTSSAAPVLTKKPLPNDDPWPKGTAH